MSVIVLIVDDDKAVRFFHQVIVAQSGLAAAPLTFSDAQQALNYLDNNYLATDSYLLLLDINMPGMDGWDLLDILKGKPYHEQAHVVMVTSSVDSADHDKANKYSMVIDVIEKPISEEACKRIIELSPLAPFF